MKLGEESPTRLYLPDFRHYKVGPVHQEESLRALLKEVVIRFFPKRRIAVAPHLGEHYTLRLSTGLVGMWLAVGCLVLFAMPALGHHSFGAEYDSSKPVTLTGMVTKIEWTNPHFYFYVDVPDKDGEVANWKFEGYPPNVLSRIGWRKDVTMRVGDTVTVFAWRARDNATLAHSRYVTFKDGKKLESGPPAGNGDGGNTPPAVSP
jgi:hypothetical protein